MTPTSLYNKQCLDYDAQMDLFKKRCAEVTDEVRKRIQNKNRDIINKRASEKEQLNQEKKVLDEKIHLIEVLDTSVASSVKGYPLLQFIDEQIQNSEKQLRQLLYVKNCLTNQNLVYSKYYNLVALTTMYEYFCSGRCDELTGAQGAYNLYENELRANQIIAQLDTIMASLESIQLTQYETYKTLTEIKNSSIAIGKTIDNIKSLLNDLSSYSLFMLKNLEALNRT